MAKIILSIRATNGAVWETDDFNLHHKVGHVLQKAVGHFVEQGVMSADDYLLALVFEGRASELPDTQSLHDAGVTAGSTLAILVRGPQVDG